MGKVWVGVSGWSYDGWRGEFYPEELSRSRELEYIGRRFNSVEINGSFYSLLKPDTYRRWYDQVPRDFLFAVKGSRFITHNKKLRDVETPLANFFASGVLALEEKLGPVVWQLSENLRFDPQRVAHFLELLPHDTEAAARLARKHDDRLKGRSWTKTDRNRRMRHAIEIRNESFFDAEFVRIARRNGAAVVLSDAADWRLTEEVTAGFVYIRLHGSEETYASRYDDDQLDRWAERIEAWRAGGQPRRPDTITDRQPPRRKTRDVYVYFDNDQHVHAPKDAERLAERLDALA
ncbi:MAG: DUF72 domain-containing protein [Gemmatimonadetes bacterium]|uniref:DUF72 domain-containing protein n=1 Tax=Candidatus Kutchimonas denitrificans TaxID=3056748 RepID=A0AAE5CCZ6_9BACT|nr:DUF72 domain-containing protein [Gemmatimonadota bacterium]NIR76713.1 DUF72 domain-containing protein [Candidatus Kutchimonas denitrificans]NIS01200.1 DUF72 domain-containing protein [Gemmatimonadota bacterium]NIT68239.1 DUF72 domain-containing protein [Gemmatimonadota bacterium]NIW75457.1 DUF72 domain-containing protein [Gemmatimonadota bacterium]